MDLRGTLQEGEAHPAAYKAKDYLLELGPEKLLLYQESFASCSIGGNRMAEICSETLSRLMSGKPVSDRYILGLAFIIRNFEDT